MVDDLWPKLLNLVHGSERAGAADPRQRSIDGLHWDEDAGWSMLDEQGDAQDEEAAALFDLFKPLLDRYTRHGQWVVAQLGQSLDACVATRTGESMFINGPHSIVHLHRLRALSEAVLIGAGTLAADDPQLTTRRVPGPNPTRVLLDPRLGVAERVPASKLFSDDQAPTLWLCDARHATAASRLVGTERVVGAPDLLRGDGSPDLPRAIAALNARGLKRLFIEGGGVTVSRFLTQGCLDRLHLSVAPVLIGNGRPGLSFAGAARLRDCQRPDARVYQLGVDHLWDLDLRSHRPN